MFRRAQTHQGDHDPHFSKPQDAWPVRLEVEFGDVGRRNREPAQLAGGQPFSEARPILHAIDEWGAGFPRLERRSIQRVGPLGQVLTHL